MTLSSWLCIIATPRHATPRHATPELFPKLRVTFIRREAANDPGWILKRIHIADADLASRFVQDDINPDYIIATDKCLVNHHDCARLRYFLREKKNSIFIFFTGECVLPDMNVFDYAFTFNRDFSLGDRIIHRMPNIISLRDGERRIRSNTLTLSQAREILTASPKFCNFLYSHPSEPRDSFFRMLSQYRHVDSFGKHLNNTGTPSTRNSPDWYSLSIELKRGYKFSIAFENASDKGYATEKITSSLQAHTVPIYWGDPAITDYINPKAFINCNDYGSFDEAIERVKEVDSDNDLWLDMVTQPWQTQEQHDRLIRDLEEYDEQVRNIFTQDIKKARRRASGYWPDRVTESFMGIIGIMPPFYFRAIRKIIRLVCRLFHIS